MKAVYPYVKERPGTVAALGTVVGYVLVIGTFLDLLPIYPSITLETSTYLSHSIAIVNAATIACLVLGWYWIRSNEVSKHRLAMLLAFGLILLFLVLYLVRIGGGGTKEFVGPSPIREAYLIMLAIHILLSVLAVPLVLYALVLGISHTPAELRKSIHARVGRVAAAVWIVSLLLGLVTYVMLEHIFEWQYAAAILVTV